MKKLITAIGTTGALCATLMSGALADDNMRTYEVSVTNLTRGVSFTPILVATHRSNVDLFTAGHEASPELATIAEGGDTGPLAAKIGATRNASTNASAGLLGPGQTATITVNAIRDARHFSLAAMMLPTNDGFIAVNNMSLPMGKSRRVTYYSSAYDAGSEPNDELCASIPGPTCGGEGASPGAGGEGFVHVHAGIHGIGNLAPADYDWRNPVAQITVRRTH